jgi:hypothetical protein
VLAVCAPLALAASRPRSGHWVGKVTKGQVGTGKNGQPSFTVEKSAERMSNFHILEVGAFCFSGYQVVTVAVPRAAITHGSVNTTYKIPNVTNAKVHLKGTFTSATTLKGEVSSNTYCDYDIKFVAHPHR